MIRPDDGYPVPITLSSDELRLIDIEPKNLPNFSCNRIPLYLGPVSPTAEQ